MPKRVMRAQLYLLRARRLLRPRNRPSARLRLAAALESCEAASTLLVVPFADVVADQAIAELTLLTTELSSRGVGGRAFVRVVELTSLERRAIVVAVSRILRFLASEAGLRYASRYPTRTGASQTA